MINFLKNLQSLVLALNPVTTFAAEPETSVVTSESNAVGGWSEEDGYFVNPQAYSKAMEDGTTYASPKHTGKAEERTHNGTSQKRAHGWTTWVGKYHYTRARMEDWGAILTDSGRQWGTDGTEAIELLLFIQKNHILFIIGFLIIFILLNILCLYLFSHILKSIYNQSTLRKKHNKIFMLNIVIPYGSAFLLGTSLATLFIKKILPISIIIGIITLALIYLINYLFLSKFLHFSSNLQQ